MEILLYQDIFQQYLAFSTEKADKQLLYKILGNENSHILYSKKYFDYIQEKIEDEDLFFQIRKSIIDDNGKNIESNAESTSFEQEYSHLYEKSGNIVLLIAHTIKPEIPKIALISQQQKPNYHWLVIQLASSHPNTLTVRHYDFINDREIDKFFANIFTIPKNISQMSIFDDNCNFEHNKFKYLKENRIKTDYYTARFNRNENNRRLQEMRTVLFPVKMFLKRGSAAHEREINFEGFIINPTHDFWCLEVEKADPKWSIHIQYCKLEAQKSLQYKEDKYDLFRE